MTENVIVNDFLNGKLLVNCRNDSRETVEELLDHLAFLGVVWNDGSPANTRGYSVDDFLYHRFRHDTNTHKQYLISSHSLNTKLPIIGIPFYVCSAFELLENIRRGQSNKFRPVPLDLTSIFV